MAQRILTPYERTHLARYGRTGLNLDDYGEMPVEYITSKVEFYSRVLTVNRDVLIPRIETEELIKLALEEAQQLFGQLPTTRPLVLADVGTGCGAIGLTLYLELQKLGIATQVYLSEVSEAALAVAKTNTLELVGKTALDDQTIVLLHSDLLADFPLDTPFDLMVANLPYIPQPRIAYLDSSVKDYEPHLALDGGPEGLTLIQKFLRQAPAYLRSTGKIILEVDHTHTESELRITGHNLRIAHRQDSFGQQRFAVIETDQPI